MNLFPNKTSAPGNPNCQREFIFLWRSLQESLLLNDTRASFPYVWIWMVRFLASALSSPQIMALGRLTTSFKKTRAILFVRWNFFFKKRTWPPGFVNNLIAPEDDASAGRRVATGPPPVHHCPACRPPAFACAFSNLQRSSAIQWYWWSKSSRCWWNCQLYFINIFGILWDTMW